MTNFLLAGGGTAGHVNPLLALADEIRSKQPNAKVIALGTAEGLEARLVPQRGYELLTIARLPFPRRLNAYAITFPRKFATAVRRCQKILTDNRIDVVVGFGGYASAPAYVAAKKLGIPVVIHEANALPGWANKLGSKSAARVAVAFRNTKLPNALRIGMPLRPEIESIASSADKEAARMHFGLKPDSATLLVTGGSLGARAINETIEASRSVLSAAGIQVLHIIGDKSDLPETKTADYVRIAYCDRMELAIASADFAVSRAGSATVAEFTACGLPAVYVPYPVGNGEQKYNVTEVVEAGGAVLVADKDFTLTYVREKLVPLVSNTKQIAQMAKAAKSVGIVDATAKLYELVMGVLK